MPCVGRPRGGMVRLSAVPVGPYAVSVWTETTPPRVGQCAVSVAVMQPESRLPVLDAVVRLTAESVDRPEQPGPSITVEASRARDPLLREEEEAIRRADKARNISSGERLQ